MTQNEYIAELLMEAADALDESAGRNGLQKRYYDEVYKSEKSKADKIDAHNRKMMDDAGWYDKEPLKAKRDKENDARSASDTYSRIKDYYSGKGKGTQREYAGNDKDRRSVASFLDTNHAIDEKFNSQIDRAIKNKHAINPIHDKINKRAQNECVADLLMEAAELLSESSLDDKWAEVRKAQSEFNKNHEERMRHLNSVLNQNKTINEDRETSKKLDQIRNDLDKLLKDLRG